MRKRILTFGSSGRERAMSLLEIMVVVTIMGIIAGIVMKVTLDKIDSAKAMKAKVDLATLRDAVGLFYVGQGFYPEALQDLVTQPSDTRVKNWPANGYMPAIPLDPWNNEYIYVLPGSNHPFEIVSLGADGIDGGEGINEDVNCWELSATAEGSQ